MRAGYFLGGSLCPTGLTVSFLASEIAAVCDALISWRSGLRQQLEQKTGLNLGACGRELDPQEAPWTKELVVDCGPWTAYVNNAIGGGDPTAAAPFLSQKLGCDCVIATHVPLHGPGHASTQLVLLGPAGEPPLMYMRTLTAHAEDGRWSWLASGTPQPFEDVERYKVRRIRDRLDRELLVSYLGRLGIHVDDATFYREAIAIRQRTTKPLRSESVSALRAKYRR